MRKLKTIAALAMAGTLSACTAKPTDGNHPDFDKGRADAAQNIGPYTTAVEFTPITAPDIQCVALVSKYSYEGNGGVTCWNKKQTAGTSPTP